MSAAEVVAAELFFPEGPAVLSDGSVVFVEQGAGRVSALTDAGATEYATTGGSPNAVVVGSDDVCYATQNGGAVGPWRSAKPVPPGIQRIDRDRSVTTLVVASDDGALHAPNDLVFAPDGALWFTDSGQPYDYDHRYATGRLVRLTAAGATTVLDVGLSYPNGVAIAADGAVLWTETYERLVCRLRPDGSRDVLAELPPEHFPDGLAVAEDGRLFVASTFGHGVSVLTPDGELLDVLRLDADAVPTNCCFRGGELFVSDFGPQWETGEGSGRLWRLQTDAVGRAVHAGEIPAPATSMGERS